MSGYAISSAAGIARSPRRPSNGSITIGSGSSPLYQFPKEHWRHLRTTNVVESPFASVRLRTMAGKRFKRVESATALIWKLLQVAEQTFRRLNAPQLLPAVYAGTRYVDGEKQTHVAHKEVAA